jgi:hypothetical protein
VSDYGVRSPAGAKDFSFILCVQTGSGAHPASCTMGTGGPFHGGKARPGRDADHSPHLVPRSWMSRSYTCSPPSASMAYSGTALLYYYYVRRTLRDIQRSSHFQPYMRRLRLTNQYIFTLRTAPAIFVETSDNSQYSTLLILESHSFTLNTCHENLKSRFTKSVLILNKLLIGILRYRADLEQILWVCRHAVLICSNICSGIRPYSF